jgi:hypothetical protein
MTARTAVRIAVEPKGIHGNSFKAPPRRSDTTRADAPFVE